MLLHYIWIKEFKNIKQKGFKFSDQYNIDYDSKSGILDIEINPKHIPNFFPENISSVTAVIGANGAGKSNLFEYLKYVLASFSQGISAIYDYESIVLFDKSVYHHEDLAISNKPDLQRNGFKFFEFKDSLTDYVNIYDAEYPEKVYENAYIYYSSILDLRSEYASFELVDISTNFLIFSEVNSSR